jgi:hypothetical protein
MNVLTVNTQMDVDEESSQGRSGRESPSSFDFVEVVADIKKSGTSLASPFAKYRMFCVPTNQEELEELCFGLIGQGAKFCIKTNCTSHHSGKKASISAGSLFVWRSNEAAFVEPTAPRNMLDIELLSNWRGERLTLDEWSNRFSIIRNTNTVATEKTFEVAEMFANNAKTFKTPLKSPTDTSRLNTMLSDVLKVKVYKRKINDVDNFIQTKPTIRTIADIMFGTEEVLEDVTTGLVATNNGLETLNYKVENELPILFSKQESMEATIGTRAVGTLSVFEAPTLWSSLSLLSEIINETRHQIIGLQDDVAKGPSEMSLIAAKTTNSIVTTKLHLLEERITVIRDRFTDNLSDLVKRVNRDSMILFNVKTKIEDMDRQSYNASQHVDKSNFGNDKKQANMIINSYDADMSGIRNMLTKLEASVRSLESDQSQDAVKFGKLGFKTLEDSSAWIEGNQHHDFGLVVDVHMIFEHVYASFNNGTVSHTAINRLHQLNKININNLSLGIAISSFDTRAPKVFTINEAGPHSKNDESFFDQIPTYAAWNLQDHGHRDRIQRQVHLFELAHKEAIRNNPLCTSNSTLYNVASKSLTDSVAWIKSFFYFIDVTYEELTRNKFAAARGWSLVTRLGLYILQDVGSPRNGVSNLFIIGDNVQICKLMFWSIIRSHDIMERYKNYDFKGDPAISGEYVRFLVMNTGQDAIEAQAKKVTEMDALIKTVRDVAKSAESKANAATTQVNDLKSKIAELTKQMKANK